MNSFDDNLQLIAVGIILIVCIIWIIRRYRRNKGGVSCGCDTAAGDKGKECRHTKSGCDGCPLSDHCSKH